MDILTFFFAWIVAVALMSAFSSLWSEIVDDNFREHELLTHIFTKGELSNFSLKQLLIGWVIHVGFGAVFLGAYEVLWQLTGIVRSIQWSLIFGLLIGIIGVVGWILMFKSCKDRPMINYIHYYIHLIVAHIVFSLSAFGVYSFMQ